MGLLFFFFLCCVSRVLTSLVLGELRIAFSIYVSVFVCLYIYLPICVSPHQIYTKIICVTISVYLCMQASFAHPIYLILLNNPSVFCLNTRMNISCLYYLDPHPTRSVNSSCTGKSPGQSECRDVFSLVLLACTPPTFVS